MSQKKKLKALQRRYDALEKRVAHLESALEFYNPLLSAALVSDKGFSQKWRKDVDERLDNHRDCINRLLSFFRRCY